MKESGETQEAMRDGNQSQTTGEIDLRVIDLAQHLVVQGRHYDGASPTKAELAEAHRLLADWYVYADIVHAFLDSVVGDDPTKRAEILRRTGVGGREAS